MQKAKPIPSRYYKILEMFLEDPNTMRMRQSTTTSFHIALLVKRGKIIRVASNRVGTRQQGCGFSNFTIHAEKNVIKQLGDVSQLKGCILYVMRIEEDKKTGKKFFRNSQPCHDCLYFLEKCQRTFGLRSIYYTLN